MLRVRALDGISMIWRANKLLAQGMRFALSGVVVSIVYIAVTTVLAEVSHVNFQLALVIGWCTAVSIHFTLQRLFVWAHENSFALSLGGQVRRYLVVACLQLGVTLTSTAVLPALVGVPAEAIYLATAVLITLINFVVFRNGIFHHHGSTQDVIAPSSYELVD